MDKRPSHETIVDALTQVQSVDALATLAGFIKITKIPKNHDAIQTAFELALMRVDPAGRLGLIAELPSLLLESKHEAEAANQQS